MTDIKLSPVLKSSALLVPPSGMKMALTEKEKLEYARGSRQRERERVAKREAERVIPEGQIEQPPEEKRKAGRPKGGYNRVSKTAIARLARNGFDPIDEMVRQYRELEDEVADMQALKNGKKINTDGSEVRYSSMALANLLSLKQKLIADLLRYGYARVPETLQVSDARPGAIVINLTPEGGNKTMIENQDRDSLVIDMETEYDDGDDGDDGDDEGDYCED